MATALPLKGLVVLDLSLFLAGPYAALRLQDLGARVIKIERPDGGDPCRSLYKEADQRDSTLFHAINRGKESVTIDLKSPEGLEQVMTLIDGADVIIQNYRPGVARRLGLGYDAVKARNPKIVYASISGYGGEGEWAHLPGQDLLAQARSGLMWLNGNAESPPTPVGLAMADIYTSSLAVQAILAGLVGRGVSGRGCLVETSLLESLLDMQFEMLAHYFQTGQKRPQRSVEASANVNAPPPYGVYPTKDGYLAIAMAPLPKLASLLEVKGSVDGYLMSIGAERDSCKAMIKEALQARTTQDWLNILEPEGIWCAEVMDWDMLIKSSQFESLNILQTVAFEGGKIFQGVAAPFKINDVRPKGTKPAPILGADTAAVLAEFS